MKKRIVIDGMNSSLCVRKVRDELIEIIGVISASVDLEKREARFESEVDITDDHIIELIEEIGYDVVSIKEI